VKSKTTNQFWKLYEKLPGQIRRQAKRAYTRFRQDPFHPSLQFKLLNQKEQLYSVRIGLSYRALGIMNEQQEITWFWIGSHAEYDTILSQIG
jgi:mRNA-degrading endonuclease RelE of RelBE toxin-antitoxin system